MNFPHLDEINGARFAHQDFRALISKAISRQGSSPTVRLLLAASRDQVTAPANQTEALHQRIRYFAAALHPIDAKTAPYGAFFPDEQAGFSDPSNYDQSVYQDGLANGKEESVSMNLSEFQAILPGQEN